MAKQPPNYAANPLRDSQATGATLIQYQLGQLRLAAGTQSLINRVGAAQKWGTPALAPWPGMAIVPDSAAYRRRSENQEDPAAGTGQRNISDTPASSSQGVSPAPDQFAQLLALFNQGRFAEGEQLARDLAANLPASGFAWKALGVMLQKQAKFDEALAATQTAVRLGADDAESHSNIGGILNSLGRAQEAETWLRKAIQQSPGFCYAHNNLGVSLETQKRLQEAEASYRTALQLKPDYVEAWQNLGTTLHLQHRFPEAEASHRQALALCPDSAAAVVRLGDAVDAQGRLKEAETCYRQALHLDIDLAAAHVGLANNLKQQGQIAAAITSYRRALQISPDDPDLHDCLLFCLCHDDTTDAATVFLEHRRFADQFEAPLRPDWPQHRNSRDPERILQIGFISGDLRKHVVAHFIGPVLARLAARPELSLHAYANHEVDDEVTLRLRQHFGHWTPVARLSDAELAAKIGEDRIDILVDLSGHTAKNRLLALARKPAPLQVGWVGYPGTSGLDAMDYCFKGPWGGPVGMADDQYTEKLIRVPVRLSFEHHWNAPEAHPLPCLTRGYVTFGSFNRVIKISPSTIGLWARVLNSVPSSRMLLGAIDHDEVRARLRADFIAAGIDEHRLIFSPHVDTAAYLAMHGEIDMLLDTFPYCGSTTTRHALWMGVPIVTLTGPTPSQQQGAAALGPPGLHEWIASTPDEYVRIAKHAAEHPQELAILRQTLRARMREQAYDEPEIAAQYFSKALRLIWRRWCAGLPAERLALDRQDLC